MQCGYCTPGLIMAAKDILDNKPDCSEEEFLTSMEGNICRCTGYSKILDAIRSAHREFNGARRADAARLRAIALVAALCRGGAAAHAGPLDEYHSALPGILKQYLVQNPRTSRGRGYNRTRVDYKGLARATGWQPYMDNLRRADHARVVAAHRGGPQGVLDQHAQCDGD